MHSSNINPHDLPSITELTHNISLAIFKVVDISHDGYLEKWEIEQSASQASREYTMLVDIVTLR